MKIVNAKYQQSKASSIRSICAEICNKDKAVLLDLPNEYKYFIKVARRAKYSVKTRCLITGGYKVWVFSKGQC